MRYRVWACAIEMKSNERRSTGRERRQGWEQKEAGLDWDREDDTGRTGARKDAGRVEMG